MQISLTHGALTRAKETLSPTQGFSLPRNITASGATGAYSSTTGETILTDVTSEMNITATGIPGYPIVGSLTYVTAEGASSIDIGGTATITLTPATRYRLPVEITVSNADYTYDFTTGEIVFSNPTDTVTYTATGLTDREYFGAVADGIADTVNIKAGTTGNKTFTSILQTARTIQTQKPESTKTVALSMAEGDQIVTPDAGEVLTEVTIEKPDTLIAGNIKNGIVIGGITGNYDNQKPEQTKTVALSMPSGDQTVTPDAGSVLTQVTIEKPDTLIAGNIKSGVVIGGVTGDYDNQKPEQTKTVALSMASGDQVINPDTDYVLTQVTVEKPNTLITDNIKYGVTIGGITGDFTHIISGGATANDILLNKTAYVDGQLVTGNITTKGSGDITVNDNIVTVPAGYYAAQATATVAAGTAGTPTATKGAVSNNSIIVTPSVTNTTGYITGDTKTGTAVTVTASELVSGTYTMTAAGTADVTNYANVSVAAGSATTPTTTITTTPALSLNSSTGVITATVSAARDITPTVEAGFVSSGTGGTVTVSGTNTLALTVYDGSVVVIPRLAAANNVILKTTDGDTLGLSE